MDRTDQKIQYISDLLLDAYEKRTHNIPISIELAKRALSLSKAINYQEYTAKSYSYLSLFNMIIGAYDESMRLAELSITIYNDLGDDRGIADAMYSIAGIYYKTNNFHSGLIYLVDCLSIYEKHGDFHNQARVQKSLGTIYEFFGDASSAVDFYQKAIESGKKANDKNLQSNAYNPLSGVYLNRNQIDRAMDTILLSIRMKEETGDLRGMAFALYGRGKVYAKMGRYDEAEADYFQSLKIHGEMGERLGRGMVLYKLGALYHEMKQYGKALESLNEALDYSTQNNTAFIKFKAYHHLYLIAKEQDNKAEALAYLEKYLDEKENVINAQTHKIIEAYQVISEKQNLELEARTQREKAEIIEKKNGELDAFFYKVSHDLKSPISTIISLDTIARERIKDGEALSYFDVYKKQAHRMNNMLDELMRLAKIDHYSERKRKIAFAHIIEECRSSFAYLPDYSRIEFQILVPDDLDFHAEWTLINTIIQNLIENAIKYSDFEKAKPLISIGISRQSDAVEIVVHDNGVGMDEETLAQIFYMFFKANHEMPGSGLGLYILSRAVEKLKGNTRVESELGSGSTFYITLPFS